MEAHSAPRRHLKHNLGTVVKLNTAAKCTRQKSHHLPAHGYRQALSTTHYSPPCHEGRSTSFDDTTRQTDCPRYGGCTTKTLRRKRREGEDAVTGRRISTPIPPHNRALGELRALTPVSLSPTPVHTRFPHSPTLIWAPRVEREEGSRRGDEKRWSKESGTGAYVVGKVVAAVREVTV